MKPKLIIRDMHAKINGNKTTHEMPSGGLDIVAPDGRTLFSVKIEEDDAISVWGGDYVKSGKRILSDKFSILPHSTNVVYIRKEIERSMS